MNITMSPAELLVATARGALGNKIFSAVFEKEDGSLREGRFRLGVKKGVKGVGLAYDPAKRANLIVYDMDKRAFRTIKLTRLKKITFDGTTIVVEGR